MQRTGKRTKGCLVISVQLILILLGVFALFNAGSEITRMVILQDNAKKIKGLVVEKHETHGSKGGRAIRREITVEYTFQGKKYRTKRYITNDAHNLVTVNESIPVKIDPENPATARLLHGESTGYLWNTAMGFAGLFLIALGIWTPVLLLKPGEKANRT
jgi:hypothetical protein